MIALIDPHWLTHPAIRWPVTLVYLTVLGLISVYGLHRYWLVWLYCQHGRRRPRPQGQFDELPAVTVQLPMFNEAHVSQRIIDAACGLHYPPDRLQIQVLDDSNDESIDLVRRRVAYWSQRGINIQLLHRKNRTGYKAGALGDALAHATGKLIAIFDADFVPPRGFLQDIVHYFTDPAVGMVQARWDHLNRDDSVLTRSQAIFLDGHFIVEHTARNRSNRWINFNGTAGMWRRETIESAGGWQHDTLTEDVDLSYRAQLTGWKFVFLPQVVCPAELPPEINAFKAQQHRWTKGSIQTAKKLLPAVIRSQMGVGVKIEAFFHLTSPMVYLYITLMALLFYPAFFVNTRPFEAGSVGSLVFGMSVFALGTASAGVFYTVSQRAQRRGLLGTVVQLPVLMSIGIGIAINNARGCLEALLGHQSTFVRTPKYNCVTGAGRRQWAQHQVIPTPSIRVWMTLLEIGMGLYTLQCARLAATSKSTVVSFPFLLLFAAGYLYVGMTGLKSQWLSRRPVVRRLFAQTS